MEQNNLQSQSKIKWAVRSLLFLVIFILGFVFFNLTMLDVTHNDITGFIYVLPALLILSIIFAIKSLKNDKWKTASIIVIILIILTIAFPFKFFIEIAKDYFDNAAMQKLPTSDDLVVKVLNKIDEPILTDTRGNIYKVEVINVSQNFLLNRNFNTGEIDYFRSIKDGDNVLIFVSDYFKDKDAVQKYLISGENLSLKVTPYSPFSNEDYDKLSEVFYVFYIDLPQEN